MNKFFTFFPPNTNYIICNYPAFSSTCNTQFQSLDSFNCYATLRISYVISSMERSRFLARNADDSFFGWDHLYWPVLRVHNFHPNRQKGLWHWKGWETQL